MKAILLIATVCCLSQLEKKYSIYETFCHWNYKTLQSIEQHKKYSIGNKAIEEIWDSELKSMKYILYAPTFKDKMRKIKEQPLRFKFLKQIMNLISNNKHYIIIETQDNGEVIEVLNYLIIVKKGKCEVAAYHQRDGNWEQIKDTTLHGLSFSNEIKDYHYEPSSSSTNLGNVIISDFKDDSIKCNYFLTNSVKVNGSIARILRIR